MFPLWKIMKQSKDQLIKQQLHQDIADKTIKLINEYKDDSFFIFLSHNLPHIPLYASKEFLGNSKRGLYGDVIEEIDHGVV